MSYQNSPQKPQAQGDLVRQHVDKHQNLTEDLCGDSVLSVPNPSGRRRCPMLRALVDLLYAGGRGVSVPSGAMSTSCTLVDENITPDPVVFTSSTPVKELCGIHTCERVCGAAHVIEYVAPAPGATGPCRPHCAGSSGAGRAKDKRDPTVAEYRLRLRKSVLFKAPKRPRVWQPFLSAK